MFRRRSAAAFTPEREREIEKAVNLARIASLPLGDNENVTVCLRKLAAHKFALEVDAETQRIAIERMKTARCAQALARVGRKRQLKAEWEARRKVDPLAKEPLVVKVSVAGSGDGVWKTWKADFRADDLTTLGPGWKKGTGAGSVVFYENTTSDDAAKFSFAGPGGAGVPGWNPQGAGNWGPNSIDKVSTDGPEAILAGMAAKFGQVVGDAPKNPDRPIHIIIRGHSRGAVSAARIASALKQKAETNKNVKIELVQFDPVPGVWSREDLTKATVTALDESTVVYSIASGYIIFAPQTVTGARRIIITKKAHGAGIKKGFGYKGVVYTGASLNNLPPGVYADDTRTFLSRYQQVGMLRKVGDEEDVTRVLRKVSGSNTSNHVAPIMDVDRHTALADAIAALHRTRT